MPAIIKPSRVSVASQTEAVRDGGLTTVSAFLLVDFSEPERLLTEQALWPMVTEQMPNGAMFDKGQLKPRSEVIIAGHALAPTDEPIQGQKVIARLGGWEKRLAVFGDRYWRLTDQGIEMLPAQPFHKMPIGNAQAFGGQNFKLNPHGKGHDSRRIVNAGYDAPLPNVEDLNSPIRSIDDVPQPAHFGPLAPDDTQRMRYAGTYDQHWIKKVSPLKPEDFNPLFHCDAPDDQRFEGYFEGGETFAISGMSRGTSTVGGQLPRLRTRGFFHQPHDESFTETTMVCDTITLFPNVEKAVLTFRGLIRGSDRFAEEIGTIMIAVEHVDAEPRPANYYLDVFNKRTDPEEAHKHALSDFQLMPEVAPATVSARRQEKLEKAQADRIRFLENQNWAARKFMEDEEMPPELIPPVDENAFGDLPLVAQPTSEEIESGDLDLAALMDDMKSLEEALMARMDEEMAKAEIQRRAIVTAAPDAVLPDIARKPIVSDEKLAKYQDLELDKDVAVGLKDVEAQLGSAQDQMLSIIDPNETERADEIEAAINEAFQIFDEPSRSDTEAVEKQFQTARARALGLPEGSLLHEARTSLNDVDLGMVDQISDPSTLQQGLNDEFLDMIGDSLPLPEIAPRETSFKRDALIPELPDTEDELSTEAMEQALAAAEGKLRSMASHLIPEGTEDDPISGLMSRVQDIAPPDSEAMDGLTPPEKAQKAKTDSLQKIDEAETSVAEALATGRQMSPAPLCPFEPLLPGVAERLGTFVVESLASGQDFKGADLAGADLRNADFSGLDLSGTFFENTDLTGANFAGAKLGKAVFAGATLDGADLSGTDLTKANISQASLRGATLTNATLNGLTVIRSDLSDLTADGAVLSEIQLIECTLDNVKLRGCKISDLQMLLGSANGFSAAGSRLERAVFMSLPLANADFSDTSMERVAFMEIQAPNVDFRRASLFSVGFMGNSDLSSSRFDALQARETSWNTAKLQESCFVRASCHSCFFNACDMEATDLRLGSFKSCLFGKSKLADSDFFGANLFSAALNQTDLRRCSMRAANLYAANLLEANLASCDLSGANLGMTSLEQPTHA
ncbi:DUF2169 domain-containing protein [Roseibium polysiphoniae]|uniref:DUF2169 domain-containing protein n=1 Tax=Roseibium polysiphoniae TaxID=2571221 RepID=UPI0032992AA7